MSNQINLTENSEKITFTAQDNGDTINVSLNESGVVSAGGVLADGDKGDITVSANGSIWTIDNGVVTTAKMGGDVTTAGKALLDDADAAAQRSTLGLSIGTNVQAQDADLQAIADLTTTGIIVRTNSGTATTRTITGNSSITVGNGSGVSGNPLIQIANGDRGDITVSNSGTTWTIDNDAVTYAKIQNVSATDRLLGRSTAGAGDIEEITCTAAGRNLLDDVDAAAQRTTLGLGTMATQAANNVAITGGSVTGLTDLSATTAEVTGTLTASHIHGNIAGSVYAHVRAAENLAKGDPVYISGSHGSGATLIAEVSKARADTPAKMPAVGVMDAAVAQNANGHMVITGQVTEFDTDAYAINDTLYVGETGGLTNAPPEGHLIQPVGRVERDNQNNGAFIVKVNGLASVLNTPHTLAFRDGDGDCNFGRVVSEDEVYIQSVYYGGSIRSDDLTDFRVFQLPDGNDTLALTDQTDGTVSAAYINSGAATNGQVLTADGAGGCAFSSVTASEIFDYTSGIGTIAQPANAKFVSFLLVGGGGGGGSGRRGAAASDRSGGGGGGCGGIVYTQIIPVSALSWPIGYTVGTAGNGGASVSTDDTNGSNGVNGGATTVAGFQALGGLLGSGGGTTTGNAGSTRADASQIIPGNTVTTQGGGAGSNGTGANASDSSNMLAGSGGGGGGGLNTSNVAGNGGRSGFMGSTNVYRIGGRAGATSVAAATAGDTSVFGVGSGGGGGSATASYRNGANGSVGGGGGGGGASPNGQASGAGGNGGSGLVRMFVYY